MLQPHYVNLMSEHLNVWLSGWWWQMLSLSHLVSEVNFSSIDTMRNMKQSIVIWTVSSCVCDDIRDRQRLSKLIGRTNTTLKVFLRDLR